MVAVAGFLRVRTKEKISAVFRNIKRMELFIEEKHLGFVEHTLYSTPDAKKSREVDLSFRMHADPEDLHKAILTSIPATNITYQYDKRYVKCRAQLLEPTTQFQLGAEFAGNVHCQPESIASLIFKEPWRNFKLFILN